MSSRLSERSNLIDVTYTQLHSVLSGHVEGTNPEQIRGFLSLRISQLKAIVDPFGKPSETARRKVNSGSVTLSDGIVLRVEDPDKDFVFAISDAFQIDEISSLILLRSFLYNEGLPIDPVDNADNTTLVQELVEAITPFYFLERLSLLRVLVPLLRAKESASEPFHDIALSILPQILPDGKKFTHSLLSEYERKVKEKIPGNISGDPKKCSRWAKQNSKEQLVILEVLFWTLWGSVACDGTTVEKVLTTAYNLTLGMEQENATFLLDEEGVQLQRDKATIWIVLTIEVLELETIADFSSLEISNNPQRSDLYTASPDSMKRIHELIYAGGTGQFACTYMAWTFVLSRVCAKAMEIKEVPESYRSFFELVLPQLNKDKGYSKDREAVHVLMSRACLEPKSGLLSLIETLLTKSPLFVTSIAWKTGSTVTDPDAIAFRSVFKGLVMSLVELVPVETIPEFDLFVEVWVALFGRSESPSVTGICSQYWQADWQTGLARRAVFDVCRTRFPIRCGQLIRLLRSMTASGFLDTDPLSTADHSSNIDDLNGERELCARHVFYYLEKLPTYSLIIPASACTGAHALYERQIESSSTIGITYSNVRPVSLPGGSVLPAGSKGRLLNGDGGDLLAVVWQHEHSGWKLLLEVLMEYAFRLLPGSGRGFRSSSFGQMGHGLGIALTLRDIGLDIDGDTDEVLITNILDLVRSVIQDNPAQGEQLMRSLEAESPAATTSAPDLVQLTTGILEEALARYSTQPKASHPFQLITSAISVLSTILAIPSYSIRVWIYIRSTTALFGSEKNPGFSSAALSAERVTGHYTMTLALLKLVEQLCEEASLLLVPDDVQVRKLKDEVLMRAARFVHTEVWLEHLGWKYTQLGDRFEIGRRISSFYLKVLQYTPPLPSDAPFPNLSQAILDLLLFKASVLAINPLMSAISAGTQMLQALYSSRRFGDARRLIYLLESHLQLIRLVLQRKCASEEVAHQLCLLEQALCGQITGGAASHDPHRSKVSPIDALAFFVKERDAGQTVPLEAIRILSIASSSLSMSRLNSSSLIGHLTDPEGVVASFVRIVQHPYDDLLLRYSTWNFIIIAMDKEPALASLFVTGKFRSLAVDTDDVDEKGKVIGFVDLASALAKAPNAVDVARDALANWEQLWESNPQLLACVLRFLVVLWRHGLEHKSVLENLRQDSKVWDQITMLACSELGPVPDLEPEAHVFADGKLKSNVHDAVAEHCYRTDIKSCALHVIGLDIGIHQKFPKSTNAKPLSFQKIESRFRSLEEFTDLISEATPSSYVPALYDALSDTLSSAFSTLTLSQLEIQIPLGQREYGNDFSFSTGLLQSRLRGRRADNAMLQKIETAERQLCSINLNLSLTHAQIALVDAWRLILHQVIPYLSVDAAQRSILLSIGVSASFDISRENRLGDMAATVHGTRIALLVSLLELAWFSNSDQASEVRSFIELSENIREIVVNEYQPPLKSVQRIYSVPFHLSLLQLLFFCVKNARPLLRRPGALNAEQRLKISSMVEASLGFVIDGLRLTFMAAHATSGLDLDKDMELLIAVFEQCTRSDVNPSSTVWLAQCQEADIIKSSLQLYTHIDLVGVANLPSLSSIKRPLYAPHLLTFHMALASTPSAAERLASEGVLSAYSNNSLSKAANVGLIDEVLSELPGHRSPAHVVYCSMLSIVTAIITSLGRNNHYFDAEACGLVQLYGEQIARALSWTIGESITLPLLEEMDQVVNVFSALARNATSTFNAKSVVENVLRAFSPLALRLLQQLNYAITHPHHLASLYEPVTEEERTLQERDSTVTDVWKRPLIVYLMHRVFQLSSNIIFTLICISKADIVLINESSDWPLQEALVVPHSKVVVGELASIGTLLELANGTLDMLRNLTNMPSGQSLVQAKLATSEKFKELNVRRGVEIARRNLEEILVYMITQLAMWLSKPELESPTVEADGEDQNMAEYQKPEPKERRGPRVSLGTRLRRGMTGEMAMDAQTLLNKAKPIIIKTDTILGKGKVDICGILATFLQTHIISPSVS
ncbi:nucleoporin subcomplex protein binding to Pom34-domain-containing protein [Lentinula aff. detonsa]|uniref:Nucleoporin subcomplex protein binding to Pom34-domain-containing protein n=1 Tax=Lentinula aff. detonsa TaxID=2804958 RepID=A0AA38NQ11_9AGAR|nr:nucleoporin subcomplex protein binding to Pom34-domain-containing protein [Lentinula aff. detonsa]KAJ3797707.1 nucleoporin subcomplex protein binding to Pom34-domain-containing protein [Lentinula aff. detonsa]